MTCRSFCYIELTLTCEQQGEGNGTPPPAEVINTCNGYYCDDWIAKHAADFPAQPHMWTENWPGWFQTWGEARPHRPSVDVAFSVARWVAKGGTYMNYYMAFGGTTFGRHTGGPLLVTSYDYDVQISEFGLPAEPKFSLTQKLHAALLAVADVLLAEGEVPLAEALTDTCETHTYGGSSPASSPCVSFLSNFGEKNTCAFEVTGGGVSVVLDVPPWSVSIVQGTCADKAAVPTVLINTKKDADDIAPTRVAVKPITEPFVVTDFETFRECVPSAGGDVVISSEPEDQLRLTLDQTDYLWVSGDITGRDFAGPATISFTMGEAGGPVVYAYVNGQLAGSSLQSVDALEEIPGVVDYVREAGRASSRRNHTAVPSAGVPVHITVKLPAGNTTLDLLVVSMGIKNYGPYLETVRVGIVSAVVVDDIPLTLYRHRAGMEGERTQIYKNGIPFPTVGDREVLPLTWYTATFATPQAPLYDELHPLALDISSSALKKGALWVNGEMLGRYWSIMAEGQCNDDCSSENYVGEYNANRCRTGCGEMSQSLYKVPYGLLHSADR